jgi:hypothetical protein
MMRLTGLVFFLLFCTAAVAQENSPYSRYGLGDISPGQNIMTRGMGGISAGVSPDIQTQSVNFTNPASYGGLRLSTFDFGAEVDTRTLKSISPSQKFTSTNLIVSYVQLGLPVKLKKANKKGIFLGMNIGLRPVSKINYKIYSLGPIQTGAPDSVFSLYEGSGGVNEAMLGFGLKIKRFSIGFNSGYRFGNKTYSTKLSIANDTLFHYPSNTSSKTNFGALFLNGGLQYEIKIKKNSLLRLGAYGALSQKMKGSQEINIQTVNYDADGNIYRIDSVYQKTGNGTVEYPASFGAGFVFQDGGNHWSFGADYEKTLWNKYKFFDQADKVQDSWKVRAGVEYLPASSNTPVKKYFQFVKYRAGFYYGPDYVNLGTKLPEYGFSFGAAFPLKIRRAYYETQTSILNTAIEFGSRGNKQSNLRESIFRISVGFSLSDLWFNRSKYY